MTLLTGGTVVDIDTAKHRPSLRLVAPPETAAWKDTDRVRVVVSEPRSERHVKDVVWTAVISILLASTAVAIGVVGAFGNVNLTPLVEGAGLASIAFGLAGLSDKFDPHSRDRE